MEQTSSDAPDADSAGARPSPPTADASPEAPPAPVRRRSALGLLADRLKSADAPLGTLIKVLGLPAAVVAALIGASQLWDMLASPRIEGRIQTLEFRCDTELTSSDRCWESPISVTMTALLANDSAIAAAIPQMRVEVDFFGQGGVPMRPTLRLGRVNTLDYSVSQQGEEWRVRRYEPIKIEPGGGETADLLFRRSESTPGETYIFGDLRKQLAMGTPEEQIQTAELRLYGQVRKRTAAMPALTDDTGFSLIATCAVRFNERLRRIILGDPRPLGKVVTHFISPYCASEEIDE